MSIRAHHVKAMLEASGKKSIVGFFASFEFGKMIVDGNMGHMHLIRSSEGNLVGSDYHGNRYYENELAGYTRKRYVIYADKFDYSASSVPPEWHGWLNYVNDYAPTRHQFEKPIYHVDTQPSNTGSLEAYAPKGSWFNPQKRNWKKYEAWSPATAGSQ